mmetsp:Transcript_22694/g.70265  ORF Transcript_22694/g.70265 Transcript_22694/m.70265 type:complete len:795 (-) Transcript_22694:232-2616(-)
MLRTAAVIIAALCAGARHAAAEDEECLAASFESITARARGRKLAAVVRRGNVWTSEDYGVSWTEGTGTERYNWITIESSRDADTIIASEASRHRVWMSNDGGDTFKYLQPTDASERSNYNALGVSDDGRTVLAVQWNSGIHYSHDAGNTWESANPANITTRWEAAAVNGKGNIMLAGGTKGIGLWMSTDAGERWSQVAVNVIGDSIAAAVMSRLGDSIAVLTGDGIVWTSKDSGATWDRHDFETFKLGKLTMADAGQLAVLPRESEDNSIWYSANWMISEIVTWEESSGPKGRDIAMSGNSHNMLVAGTGIYQTANHGRDWYRMACEQPGSVFQWRSVVVDHDGHRIAAVDASKGVWLSLNQNNKHTGETFEKAKIEEDPIGNRFWTDVAISHRGEVIAAVDRGAGGVWITEDLGETWEDKAPATNGSTAWSAVAIDGKTIVVTTAKDSDAEEQDIWITHDTGDTWKPWAGGKEVDWTDVQVSKQSSVIVACDGHAGKLWKSTDRGENFAEQNTESESTSGWGWERIGMDRNGDHIAAVASHSYVWVGSKGDADWQPKRAITGKRELWRSVAVSGDGSHMLAVRSEGNDGNIWVSENSGEDWAKLEGTGLPDTANFNDVAISGDGFTHVVVTSPGSLWLSHEKGQQVRRFRRVAITDPSVPAEPDWPGQDREATPEGRSDEDGGLIAGVTIVAVAAVFVAILVLAQRRWSLFSRGGGDGGGKFSTLSTPRGGDGHHIVDQDGQIPGEMLVDVDLSGGVGPPSPGVAMNVLGGEPRRRNRGDSGDNPREPTMHMV